MKVITTTGATLWLIAMGLLFWPDAAVAGDPSWRPTYDVAMRWLNFIILATVIVKYGRQPIKNFLKLKKEDVVSEIEGLDKEKEKILQAIEAAKEQEIENKKRFKALQDRLIAQGENRKQQLIAQAKQQSVVMLEEARRKMENRIVQANASLKMELLDMAIGQAIEKLPEVITDGDNQRLLDDYMAHLRT